MKTYDAKHITLAFLLSAAVLAGSAESMAALNIGTNEAKTITIIDGANRVKTQTNASTFDRVLKEKHISMGEHDSYWSSSKNVENGSVIVVERAVPVTIEYQGKQKTVYTTDQTVQGALNSAGYNWKKVMPLEDGMSKVREGMVIHVVPYEIKTVTRTEATEPEYARWYDSSLGEGNDVIITAGTPGERKVTVQEFVVDGKVIKTDILNSEVISTGTPGVMKTGSKENTIGYVTQMNATAYHPADGNGEGITATGTRAGQGTIAVDPSVIPLGSSVFIPGYGNAVAADTGGAITGNRVDLCMETYAECYAFGRKIVDVFVNY